jgi:hypothetical protein
VILSVQNLDASKRPVYWCVFFSVVRGWHLGECGASPVVLLGDFRRFSRVLGAPNLTTVALLRSLMTVPSHPTQHNLHS